MQIIERGIKGCHASEIELRLLQKNMFRCDSAEALISKSPHRFVLKPKDVPVASIAPKDRPRAVQAVRKSHGVDDVPVITTKPAQRATTPPRRQAESKVTSPYTKAAEERLLALKKLLAE